MNLPDKRIACFSMEIAVDRATQTNSTDIGILADTLRAAA
jgi:hypothetical protein